MLVAGPFERGPAAKSTRAKSTRAEVYGYECDEYFETWFRYLEAHSQIGSIVLPARLYFSPCIQTLMLRYTRKPR